MNRRTKYKGFRDDFDGAWKNMLTERRFESFVAIFMPDVHDLIDWTQEVKFKEQELRAITRKTKRGHRSVDRLVKAWLKSGVETWILVHVEIQSQEDENFPQRMFQCRYRTVELFFDWLLGLPDHLAEQYNAQMIVFEEEREMPHLSTAERIGMIKGQCELLADMLESKFGTIPEGAIAKLNAMYAKQLRRLGQKILTAKSLEELGLVGS